MWEVIKGISINNPECSTILTTHSMKEAETLSHRMGIMIRGGIFKCFGTSDHIKNKYGEGYEAEFRIRVLSKEQAFKNEQNLGIDGKVLSFSELTDIAVKSKMIPQSDKKDFVQRGL